MNLKTLLAFIGVTVGILVGVGALLWQFGSVASKPLLDVAGDSRLKKGSGEIMIVEFSDFQCPACASVQEPLDKILSKYEGKVTFIYRHFPLVSIHKNALLAAYATEAAFMQNKFFEFGNILFAKQKEWEGLSDPKEMFRKYAASINLDSAKFFADLDSQQVKERVAADQAYANRHALSGTPTFFVNGIQVDFADLESRILELVK